MAIVLTQWDAESEPTDPAFAGDWAAVIATLGANPPLPWCWYLARNNGVPVGCGVFKAPPQDGAVEIAYLTFLPARRRGMATQIAAALVDIARREGIERVLAHTLPAEGPSTRALRVNDFTMTGAVEDPDDGTVWRWERALP